MSFGLCHPCKTFGQQRTSSIRGAARWCATCTFDEIHGQISLDRDFHDRGCFGGPFQLFGSVHGVRDRVEFEVSTAGSGDDLGGSAEEADPEAARLPPADLAGQYEHRHAGQEIEGDLDDLQLGSVLRGVGQGQAARVRSSARGCSPSTTARATTG